MKKIEIRYLADGNHWRTYVFESGDRYHEALNFRNIDKFSDYIEVKLGGKYNPNVPNFYKADRLAVIKDKLENEYGIPVNIVTDASPTEHFGATPDRGGV
jgi:hypothetical protein